MPQRSTSIAIPTPCSKSWAAMTPTNAGRHCAACEKTVVDFMQKTDAEILAYLAQAAGGRSCGRFRPEQLARPLQPAETASSWRSWLGTVVTLLGVLSAGRAAAQVGYSPAAVAAHPAPDRAARQPAVGTPARPETAAPTEPQQFRGVVSDATTGERIPGVTVLLAGTTVGASTDAHGEFAFAAPTGTLAPVLVISSVGYTTVRLPASAEPMTVQLQVDATALSGEVVVVGGYRSVRPWPWHPRALYYWLSRPFRRL
jgi:hypothetical protein